jgi:hypothetical protein
MHIEKNVCENVIKFIIGVKDTFKVRKDMEVCGVWEHLWLKRDPHKPSKIFQPIASYVLKLEELETFMGRLGALKVPSDYYSAMGKHVMDKKLGNMKSHDWHVLMQQFMPLAWRGLMDTNVRLSLMRLNQVFRKICAKVWDPSLPSLKKDVGVTLSIIEWELPGAFFDVMTHLVLHVVEELAICRPVHSRWMYPVERTLGTLKKYVRNQARPEASMASRYVLDETLGFVTKYMQMFTQVCRRVWDANEEEGVYGEVLEGSRSKFRLLPSTRDLAHQYVLTNAACLAPWVRYFPPKPNTHSIFMTWYYIYKMLHVGHIMQPCRPPMW